LLVLSFGAAWSCSPFGADGGSAPAPDASTSDASADASADAGADALDAPPPDAGGGVEGGPGGDGGALHGAKCTGPTTFCATTEGCCFQVGTAPDACLDKASPCTPAAGITSAAFLTCTDRESCPRALPFCCLGLSSSKVATGSTCQAAACAATQPQLCAPNDKCTVGTCVGKGGAYSLDDFQTYCQ
jgi:hypothetical protein